MPTLTGMLVFALALGACDPTEVGTSTSTSNPSAVTNTNPTDSGTSTTAIVTTTSETAPADIPAGPSYDVYLAAVAEAVSDTRFVDVPFSQPELTVATGLALCEALAAGEDTDAVLADFLTQLTDGEPSAADEDQLVLSGALLGAAETALCADAP